MPRRFSRHTCSTLSSLKAWDLSEVSTNLKVRGKASYCAWRKIQWRILFGTIATGDDRCSQDEEGKYALWKRVTHTDDTRLQCMQTYSESIFQVKS